MAKVLQKAGSVLSKQLLEVMAENWGMVGVSGVGEKGGVIKFEQ